MGQNACTISKWGKNSYPINMGSKSLNISK
jgi:hypothetical protein